MGNMFGKLLNMNNNFHINYFNYTNFYNIRTAVLPICKYKDEYLILRISNDWKLCPGDWDFVISTFQNQKLNPEFNAILSIKKHLWINAKKVKVYPVLFWQDRENHVLFKLFPFLFNINHKNIVLSKKFSDIKWVKINNILNFDRNDYLKSIIAHIDNHGGL